MITITILLWYAIAAVAIKLCWKWLQDFGNIPKEEAEQIMSAGMLWLLSPLILPIMIAGFITVAIFTLIGKFLTGK